MKTIVPFAISDGSWALAACKLALRQDGINAEFHHMVDDTAYYRLLDGLWSAGESFAVVEHDIVVWPGALQELENCPHPWCTMPYYCSVGWINDGLGCTKFSAEFLTAYPEFLKEPFPACCAHSTYYCGLDRFIAHRGESLGLQPHVHNPGVVNLNAKWT